MKFTIVIPSFLGPYATAARNREEKLLRAVDSCLNQTYEDFEVNVVADGCGKTLNIMEQVTDKRVNTFYIEKKGHFSGRPRNKGIEEARGEWIAYLDIDDVFGENHLEIIASQLRSWDWVWFNDIRYFYRMKAWYENPCDIRVKSMNGTSNICHRSDLEVEWTHTGYAHDFYFTQQLLKFKHFTKIKTPEYYVCHIPGAKINGGYDL